MERHEGKDWGAAETTETSGETLDADGPDAFRDLLTQLSELVSYGTYYVATKTDSVKATIKGGLLLAVLGIATAIAAIALICKSAVVLVAGIAGGLGALFGALWAGELVTGVGLLALVLGGGYLFVNRIRGGWNAAVREKLEALERAQKLQFGRNVSERAAAATKH